MEWSRWQFPYHIPPNRSSDKTLSYTYLIACYTLKMIYSMLVCHEFSMNLEIPHQETTWSMYQKSLKCEGTGGE